MKFIVGLLVYCFTQISIAAIEPSVFLQTSGRAIIAKLHKNNYLLTLNNPSDYINFLTKKPATSIGISKVSNFLALWNHKIKNNFSEHPPQASLAVITEKGEYQQAKVIVTNPSLSRGTLTYQITTTDVALHIGKLKHMLLVFDEFPVNLDKL